MVSGDAAVLFHYVSTLLRCLAFPWIALFVRSHSLFLGGINPATKEATWWGYLFPSNSLETFHLEQHKQSH
jgi:hypothetical protein